jgi:hypothetical protein
MNSKRLTTRCAGPKLARIALRMEGEQLFEQKLRKPGVLAVEILR